VTHSAKGSIGPIECGVAVTNSALVQYIDLISGKVGEVSQISEGITLLAVDKIHPKDGLQRQDRLSRCTSFVAGD
jgi:hypothetical protein